MNDSGIPLGKYLISCDVKIGDPVKIEYKKKIMNGKVHKVGSGGIDVKANGKYYFCRTHDKIRQVFTDVTITKAYNEKN